MIGLSLTSPLNSRFHGKRGRTPIDTHAIRKNKVKLEKLAQAIGSDGHYLLVAIYRILQGAKSFHFANISTIVCKWIIGMRVVV